MSSSKQAVMVSDVPDLFTVVDREGTRVGGVTSNADVAAAELASIAKAHFGGPNGPYQLHTISSPTRYIRTLEHMCAWLAGEVTEGWLVERLGASRINIRTARDRAIGKVIGNGEYVCPMGAWEDRARAAESVSADLVAACKTLVRIARDAADSDDAAGEHRAATVARAAAEAAEAAITKATGGAQ